METTVEVKPVESTEDTAKRKPADFNLVASIVKMLEPLSLDEQKHILQTVLTWLHLTDFAPKRPEAATTCVPESSQPDYPFSGRDETTPKEFLLEKDSKTDVERMTCLGYYLTHFRDQPYFKTEDLSKLNTDAAQRKFSNAAVAANNAFSLGFFVQAPKQGFKQLSALGEQYVQALPDREAARLVRKRMKGHRPRANSRKEQLGGTETRGT
jgi:hypothetical protein